VKERKFSDCEFSRKGMKIIKQVLIALIAISGTIEAVTSAEAESKNTSEDYNNLYYDDYEKLAQFQNHVESHTGELCTEKAKASFSPYDYAVVITMLAVSLKIGVFYGFCHKGSSLESSSSSDFMLGSKMGLFPVTFSLTTSFVTAIELLGNPAEVFFFGSQFTLIGNRPQLHLFHAILIQIIPFQSSP
jgi:hypothetical protein